ncbi:Enamine/imine deaminase [Legionella busanensis]|uniref:Enamine/imine deaminase n=1 Tax=Legionella busanensis TaxID=190655 RepID=A0A378JHF7_9GAMM|nr:RidA family protein [Legionella busanensis]STX50447.1 Enamine/imine deaminase [Legionella busanensis]
MDELNKQTYSTGTIWEEMGGFSRAIRIGRHIYIAGTTATKPAGLVGKNDPKKQMEFILNRIEQSIITLGGTLQDVVRTRFYVENIADWESVARVHGLKFKLIKPVNTLVQAKLVGNCLVEVEAEAIIQSTI